MASLSILENDAIENRVSILNLNANFFAKELNQDMQSLELIIDNMYLVTDFDEPVNIINGKLEKLIKKYHQIRSINILKENKIIYSSNDKNLSLYIKTNTFYPKPLFKNNVLRVSNSWIGRDLYSNFDTKLNNKKYSNISFIPILKNIYVDENKYSVIITLSNDYFKNKFLNTFKLYDISVDLMRIDEKLLFSTTSNKINTKKTDSSLLKDALIQNFSSGIEYIEKNKSNIVSYILTEDYPFIISVYSDLEQSLSSWEEKRYEFFLVSTLLVLIFLSIAFMSFFLYQKEKEKEVLWHKLQIKDNKKFKTLFENSHFIAFIFNEKGKVIDLNVNASSFLGFKKNELKYKYIWDFNCWNIKENIKLKQIISEFNGDSSLEFELIATNNQNKKRTIEFVLSSISMNNKLELILVGLDITQKKKREEKLKQAYTVFNKTRDGIMITDKDTRIVDVNRAFEVITGYSKLESFNQHTRILKSKNHPDSFYKVLWEKLIQNSYWEGEIVNKRKDGTLYTEWLTINAIHDENKNVLNYIGIFSDITDQKNKVKLLKEKESLLFQQSKLASMGEMIENIAHQWRQPLSVISTASTGVLLQKELGLSIEEDEIKYLEAINESSQYLSKTIDDFRNFLKEDKVLTNFNIKTLMEQCLKLTSSKFVNEGIIVKNNISDIMIMGQRNELIQVVINILNNAKDALVEENIENKYIFVESLIKEKRIILKIRDNAGGIPDNIIDRIFEPYFTTKHKSRGTGIGLYMSSEIIKKQANASIFVENQEFIYENTACIGAEFRIELPLY